MPTDTATVKLQRWVWVTPPIWSTHPQGANFLSKIRADEAAPGGLHRTFLPRAKGVDGFVMRSLVPGDPWEMGSVRTTPLGAVEKPRMWGVVIKIDANEMTCLPVDSADLALQFSANIIKNLPGVGPIQTLQRQLMKLQDRKAEIEEEIENASQQIAILQMQEHQEMQHRAEEMGMDEEQVPPATQIVQPHSVLRSPVHIKSRQEDELLGAIRKMADPEQRAELLAMMRTMVDSVDRRGREDMEVPDAGEQGQDPSPGDGNAARN